MNDDQSLRDFVATYARPYDPESDVYDRPPFAADIKEGKNDPIYNAHSYHTKVPPRGIMPYILHYTRPGDLILDPFCGSGMTGVAAQMCANPPADLLEQFPELKERVGPRACILNDLSPAACHIAYNYNTPVDVDALRQEFERIKAAVKDEFDWLYGTDHYEPAVGLYDPASADLASRLKNPPGGGSMHTLLGGEERTGKISTRGKNAGKSVMSKKRVARGCGKDIVLKNASLVHGHDDRQGSTFTCPYCNTTWQKSPLPWLRSDPVESYVSWCGLDRHARNYMRRISLKEAELALKEPKSGDWFPADELYENSELLTMGAGKRGIKRVSNFYFPRQLRSLAHLFSFIESIGDQCLRKASLFCFTAIALKCSRLNRLRPSGVGDPLTGTLYIGSLIREENVGETWQRRTEVAMETLASVKSKAVWVCQGDAAKPSLLKDSSVDFVFADPPFGGNIFYADASLL